MSSEVEIHLIAYDEASTVIESVGSNLSATFTDIEGNTQELASSTSDATSQISDDYSQVDDSAQSMSDSVDTANQSCSSSAMSMNGAALAGMSLYMSFNSLENAEISLDRAHVTVEKDTLAVQKAQEAYNAAVAKYGPDSQQAKDASQKLKDTQDTLTVAQERAGEAQRNVNNSMVMAALTVIPSLISIINVVSNAESIWEGIQWALNAAMDANPIGIVILAITALVAIIIVAWNACPPFRNALIEIGHVLGGALKASVEAITIGLTWFWNNVLEPLAKFLAAVFGPQIEALSVIVGWLWNNVFKPLGDFLAAVFYDDIKMVSDICFILWNNVLKPFGDFLEGAFSQAWKNLEALFQWFYDLVKPIIDAVEKVGDTLGKFVDSVSGAMKGAGGAIQGFIRSVCFAHALSDASDSSTKTLTDWVSMVEEKMGKGLAAIKDFNAQAQIQGAPGVGVAGAVGSVPVSSGKAQVVSVIMQAPMVNIEGSADKATVDLASKQVLQSLQTIIVEPTSSAAGATQKRIRQGSVFT